MWRAAYFAVFRPWFENLKSSRRDCISSNLSIMVPNWVKTFQLCLISSHTVQGEESCLLFVFSKWWTSERWYWQTVFTLPSLEAGLFPHLWHFTRLPSLSTTYSVLQYLALDCFTPWKTKHRRGGVVGNLKDYNREMDTISRISNVYKHRKKK